MSARRNIRVLVVDDDPDMLALIERWLSHDGTTVTSCLSGREALARMDVTRPDLVVTDLVMDEMDGLRLLTEVHRHDPVMPVIMMSGQAGVSDAMQAARLGATAFVTKPLEKDVLLAAVDEALARSNAGLASADRFAKAFVHQSTSIASLLDKARRVAAVESTVLITGSTGTGKEVLARAIHEGSRRRDKPFVSVNCSAIPEQLLESELFGHERGAFTGATTRHAGMFREADGGTLFLDEIGDMPRPLQAKLLRVLQDFQVRPVGGERSVPVDVRVVSATHRDLEAAIAAGEFREDLFYRLSVVPLHIPDLEQRRDDIAPIAEHLLEKLAGRLGDGRKRLGPGVPEYLACASWPGNVRQLANVIEQCWVLTPGNSIPLERVEDAVRAGAAPLRTLDEAREGFDRRYLVSVLRIAEGNVTAAARIAGRNRTEFYKLLGRHALDPAEFRPTAEASPDDDGPDA